MSADTHRGWWDLLLIGAITDLVGAWALMQLVPYAHRHLGTPDLHLGYGTCLVLILLATVGAVFRSSILGVD